MSDWTEQKIAEMITNKIEESSALDWKRSDALLERDKKSKDDVRNELSKDVSSFANAAGGTLIYGVIEEKDPPHRPVDFDAGIDPTVVTKEWLDDVISSVIHPAVKDVQIIPVSINGYRPDKYAYVVEIAQSHTIHQARERKYYRRRNFKAEPMEDWEIREGMLRSRTPVIEFHKEWKVLHRENRLHKCELNISLRNVGSVRTHDLMFQIDVPDRILPQPVTSVSTRGNITIDKVPIQSINGVDYRRLSIAFTQGGFVLFPTQQISLADYQFRIEYHIDTDVDSKMLSCPIKWWIYADDASPRTGEFELRGIQRF